MRRVATQEPPAGPSADSSRKGNIVQGRRGRPERGQDDADIPSVAADLGMMAQSGDARVVGIHQHKQGREDAKDQMQGIAIGEGQRQPEQNARYNGDEGKGALALLEQHDEYVICPGRVLVLRCGIKGRIEHGHLVVMGEGFGGAREARGEEGQPAHDEAVVVGLDDLLWFPGQVGQDLAEEGNRVEHALRALAIHMIGPGGGTSSDGSRWIACTPGFFLHVHVLSRLFHRLFLEGLLALHHAGQLLLFGGQSGLADAGAFSTWLSPFRKAEWVVYAKPPFGGPEAVLAYLRR